MTWPTFYEALKYWLPIVTVLTLAYKGSVATGKGVKKWADALLDNHLTHIQTATEGVAKSMVELVESQKASTTAMTRLAEAQNQLVLGIEILKDRSSQARQQSPFTISTHTTVSAPPAMACDGPNPADYCPDNPAAIVAEALPDSTSPSDIQQL